MKNLKKLAFVLVTCLGVSAAANATDGKEDKPSELVCSLFPASCVPVVNGGNGGGRMPPTPPILK